MEQCTGNVQVWLGVPPLLPAGPFDVRAENGGVVEVEVVSPDEFRAVEIGLEIGLFRIHGLIGEFGCVGPSVCC